MSDTRLIQSIIYADSDICDDDELYFRHEGKSLDIETYFNAFSIGKWKKYTVLDNLSLRVETANQLTIKAYNAVGKTLDGCDTFVDRPRDYDMKPYVAAVRHEVDCAVTKTDYGYEVDFATLPDEGILYIVATSDEDIVITGGGYYTTTTPRIDPKLAIGICTFKREEFLKRNVGSLIDKIIDNVNSPLHDRLDVYVSDNGQTIDPDSFSSDRVKLYPNINAGGAGGFTRTMIEAIIANPGHDYTHMILMDDDIVLDTRVLERTYHFLSYIRPEYAKAMLGGHMFELERRFMQYECGANAFGHRVTFRNRYFDMRDRVYVSANEYEKPINYSGWWYNVIPSSLIREDNLPVPAFIHCDDVEYGVRNRENGTILINGICVWHPQNPGKAPVSMGYYDVRNNLIMQALSDISDSKFRTFGYMSMLTVGEVIRYRYNSADARFLGYEDFHRGPDYFCQLDPVDYHRTLSANNNRFVSPSEAGVDTARLEHLNSSFDNRLLLFILTALCWIFPPMQKYRVVGFDSLALPFVAKKLYVYDKDKAAGFIVKRSYKSGWTGFCRYWHMVYLITRYYRSDLAMWKANKERFTSYEFWKQYLKL